MLQGDALMDNRTSLKARAGPQLYGTCMQPWEFIAQSVRASRAETDWAVFRSVLCTPPVKATPSLGRLTSFKIESRTSTESDDPTPTLALRGWVDFTLYTPRSANIHCTELNTVDLHRSLRSSSWHLLLIKCLSQFTISHMVSVVL